MPKHKAKRARTPSPSESSSESSGSESSASSVSSTRKLDGDRDDSDETGSEIDVKDQYLPKHFQPKPPKVKVSKWAKSRVRGPYLGTKIGKDERAEFLDQYYCSPEDHKLFAAPKIADSPLSLLVYKNSTAQDDLIRVNNDILFGLRVGLMHYEKCLDLKAMWGEEKTVNDLVYPAGPWHNMGYSFRGNLPVPLPYEIRKDVQANDVASFLQEPFIKDVSDGEKLQVMAAYALSYRESFRRLKETALRAHDEAMLLDDSLQRCQEDVDSIALDTGNSLRLFGNACQQVKDIRESAYVKELDNDFKRFVSRKRSAKSPKDKMKSRADDFVDDDLVGLAKAFGKEKKAMESISKEKQKKERIRRIHAAKKAEAKDRASGAGSSKPYKKQTSSDNPRKAKKPKKVPPKKKAKESKESKDKDGE